jgi:RNA polymerase sigma-70 factor (ECF subfamily)
MIERNRLTGLSDNELVRRVVARDLRAFDELYDRHHAQAYSLAMYMTGRRGAAEEVTQDAFLALWRTSSRYDPARGSLKTWLLSVVRHRAIDLIRSGACHASDLEFDDGLAGLLEAPERTEEIVVADERAAHARELLRLLPVDQRRVVELAYFRGFTQSEIAASTGVPLGTVKGRQRLAMQKLQGATSADTSFAIR